MTELATAGSATVDNKANGDIYVFAEWNVLQWSNATNTWSRVITGTTTYGQSAATALDGSRNRILLVGGTGADQAVYDLSTNSVQKVSFTGAAAASIMGNGNGMVYVPAMDAYLLRTGDAGDTVYRIDAQTFAVDVLPTTGGAAMPATTNGVWRRFLYVPALKGVVYVPTYEDGLWFLRTN
jgi:hypothetical protein